jgi:putative ABC transport system permease protein
MVSFVTMVLFTVGPAMTACRSNLQDLLRSARASAQGRGRQVLVAFQIGLCTFVLTLAGLFVRTVHDLRQTYPGFDVAHIVTFTGDLSRLSNQTDFVTQLIGQVRQIPGVVAAGMASRGVMRGSGLLMTVAPAGERITSRDFLDTSVNRVTPGYFEALGLRILSGRDFSPADGPGPDPQMPTKAVVNQAFVERFFPSGSVLGRRFGRGATGIATGQYEVVGVVTEAKYRTLREPIVPTFYTPQTEFSSFVLNVRTVRQPATVIDPVRKIWEAVGSSVPLLEIHTMAEEVDQSTSNERFTAQVASLFGGVAMFLVGVGLYGVLAYFVGQRKREIAIRMALGGNRGAISLLILRQTLSLLAAGIALGVVTVLLAGPSYRSLLYGVSPLDLPSLAISALFVVIVGMFAIARPVYRATRIEPGAELKDDN